MSLGLNWEATLERLRQGMLSSVDWNRREGYVIDCASVLAHRLGRKEEAKNLLVEAGTERPSYRLAVELSLLLLEEKEYSGAYDWSLEALALADDRQIQASRLRTAYIGMDYLNENVEAKAYLRDYVDAGGADVEALRRLRRLTPDVDLEDKIRVLSHLIQVLDEPDERLRCRIDLIFLCEVSKPDWQLGLETFIHSELDECTESRVILSAYRIAKRLDEMSMFEEILKKRGIDFVHHSEAITVENGEMGKDVRSREEGLLLALINGHFQDDLEAWINESASVFGARIVPILENLADVLEKEGRDYRHVRERALEIALSDLDVECFPSSAYQLLGDAFCSASASGGVRIRAEQLGHRFPSLRYHSFSLAGFEALKLNQSAKAQACFLEAGKINALGRAQARALRLLLWHKQDYEGVRRDLESELELVPLGSRRELQLELALLDEFLGQFERAEFQYRKILETARGWLPAAYGLGTLLDRQGRWRELASFVHDELRQSSLDKGSDLGLIGRLAEIYEHHLDQLDLSADLYEQVLQQKPSAPDAILGLMRIYERQGRWQNLLELLKTLATVYGTGRSRGTALYRAGEIAEFRLNDPNAAVELYREAFAHHDDEVIEWAMECAVLKSQNRHAIFGFYQEQDGKGTIAHSVKKALTLSPMEALDTVESLMIQDQHPLWAFLYGQLSRELQRVEQSAVGLANLAERVVVPDERFGLIFESYRLRWHQLSNGERFEMLTLIPSDAQAARLVLSKILSSEVGAVDSASFLIGLSDWWQNGNEDDSETTVLGLFRYLLTLDVHGRESAAEWFASNAAAMNFWPEHIRSLGYVEVDSPADRATALLSVAKTYGEKGEAGVCAFEAGRIFEQNGLLPQAANAYRLALTVDSDLIAAASSLVNLVGMALTPESAFRTLFEAAGRSSTDAHSAALIGLCLKNDLTSDGVEDRQWDLLQRLREIDAVNGFERPLIENLLARGSLTDAIEMLRSFVEIENDVSQLIWANLQLGELSLRQHDVSTSITCFRNALGLGSELEGQAGLSFAYLMNSDADLARLSYRRLEELGHESELSYALEGRLGRLVSLVMLGRGEAAELLLADLPEADVSPRGDRLLEMLGADLRERLPARLGMEMGSATKSSSATEIEIRVPDWLRETSGEMSDMVRSQIEQAWELQRHGWFNGTLLTVPQLRRLPNALNRRLIETLLPNQVHPALVDSLADFARLNDMYGTDVSGPLAPLSPLEVQRLDQLAVSLGTESFELRLDPVNAFRLDCKSGPSPCVVLGERLFEMVGVDQLEFLIGWALAVTQIGALPPPFMRAARRFGVADLENVIDWIKASANGETKKTIGQDWRGGELFRKQTIDVIEWTTALGQLNVNILYEELQRFGLHIACSLAASFGVPMETIRLIEMDERSLEFLTSAQLQEAVELSSMLRQIHEFSRDAKCIEARSCLFTLDSHES